MPQGCPVGNPYISGTDVDGINAAYHVKDCRGFFAWLEAKTYGAPIPEGQRILFNNILKIPQFPFVMVAEFEYQPINQTCDFAKFGYETTAFPRRVFIKCRQESYEYAKKYVAEIPGLEVKYDVRPCGILVVITDRPNDDITSYQCSSQWRQIWWLLQYYVEDLLK